MFFISIPDPKWLLIILINWSSLPSSSQTSGRSESCWPDRSYCRKGELLNSGWFCLRILSQPWLLRTNKLLNP